MDDRGLLVQHLAQAARHIAEGKQHIAKQRDIIEALERDGHAAAAVRARDFLRVLLETQDGHEKHRQSILNRLHK